MALLSNCFPFLCLIYMHWTGMQMESGEWTIREEKKMVKGHIDIPEFSFGELDDLQVCFTYPFECYREVKWRKWQQIDGECSLFDEPWISLTLVMWWLVEAMCCKDNTNGQLNPNPIGWCYVMLSFTVLLCYDGFFHFKYQILPLLGRFKVKSQQMHKKGKWT